MEYVTVELLIKKEIIEKIEKITQFHNIRNNLYQNKERYYTFEDFIIGTLYHYLDEIEFYKTHTELKELGKPFQLRNNFKEIATKKGISQERLAEITGINPSNISLIFRNKNQPSLDYFLRIWIALDCPPLNKCLYRIKK